MQIIRIIQKTGEEFNEILMTPNSLISRTFKQQVTDVLQLCMVRVKHVMNLAEMSMPCNP